MPFRFDVTRKNGTVVNAEDEKIAPPPALHQVIEVEVGQRFLWAEVTAVDAEPSPTVGGPIVYAVQAREL